MAIRWSFSQSVLSLTGPNGKTIMYNASLGQTTMTLTGAGLETPQVFRRSGSESGGEMEQTEADAGSSPAGGLVGRWQGNNGVIQLNPDGTAVYNGTNLRYTVEGNVLTLTGNDGALPIPFSIKGDTLYVTVQGQSGQLTRVRGQQGGAMAGGGGSGSVPQDMVGKWCYVNVSDTGQVSSSSSSCFVLNPDGTYEYSGESSNSNMYGGTASQSSDRGTWWVSGSTVSVNSQQKGPMTYQLEKRNHPKNNDPMLCRDGQCFVTAYQKAPWPY